jgi:TPP-dependent pyruvate/acetoin dehydrogenase alpha subunit
MKKKASTNTKNLDKEKLQNMYRDMWRIRKFEYAVAECVNRGLVSGPHLYVGEEAIAVGVCAALRKEDYITSTHRGHGHCIAKGGEMKPMLAELLAKETGYCKGKGGSMHIADVSLGILGANGIVGGGFPIAAGAALGALVLKKDWVAVGFFGDAATNTGSFHEALNLASVWKLPVVYVCENNCFGMFTPACDSTSVDDISIRAKSYNMPGITVDGNDILAVYEAAKEAIDRARSGKGPSLIECKTSRQLGHYQGDTQRYRDPDDVKRTEKNDPIPRFRSFLVSSGALTETLADEIEAGVQKEADEAIQFAVDSPEPDMSELTKDVYVPFKPI